MDDTSGRESRHRNPVTEMPASFASLYSSFENSGVDLGTSDQGYDETDLPYGDEIDPMLECMGAPTRDVPVSAAKFSTAQEEAILATVIETFNRAKELEISKALDLQSLKDASNLMQQLWEGGSLLFLSSVEVLVELNASGRFSAALGEAGFVDMFLDILRTADVIDAIVVPSLQFVGDACEKTEMNKARVVEREGIQPILYKLWNPSLVQIAIPTVYQICVNYEPAQQQVANLATARILIDLLKRQEGEGIPTGGGAYPVLLTTCRVLDMMLAIGTELYSDATSKELFELTKKNGGNPDLYIQLINTATTWLKLKRVRLHFVANDNAELLLFMLEESCTGPNLVILSTSEGEKLLQKLRIAIVEALAAISLAPQFCVNYKLNGKFVTKLREWLLMAYPQLQACSCIVLGNMANSWTSAKEMIRQFQLHDVALLLLEQCDSVQVKAAAAVLLKSLLLSSECRKEVAEKPVIKVASQLWGMARSPHLQYLGVALTLQALEGSFPILEQLLAPLSPDPDSPAHSKTYLTILLRLWQDYHGYQQHKKLLRTVACIIANVCAMLWSQSSALREPEQIEELKKRILLQHADVGYPLSSLLKDESQPTVRSKFWYVMALMAGDPQAIGVVSNTIAAPEVSMVLSESLLRIRQFAEGQQEERQGRDQYDGRNILILVSQLGKKADSLQYRRQSEFIMKMAEGIDLEAMEKELPAEPV